jgi:hypothetical protein
MRLQPDFAVVGAQKSASTALAESLRQHPDIFMPAGETHYFRDPEYATAVPGDLQRLFVGTGDVKRRGFKCPELLGQEPCAQRLASELGDVDIIAVLRNPVDRALSHYSWLVRWGQLPVEPVDEGLRKLLRGEFRGIRQADEILEFGLYGKHLERYLSVFGQDRLVVLLDSDLRRNPQDARAQVYGHLGVDEQFEPRIPRSSRNEGVYPLRRLRFLRLRNRFVFDNGDPMTGTLRRPTRPLQALPNAAIVLADRYLLAPLLGNERPPLSADVRDRLVTFYAKDVEKTEALIGRSLSEWNRR